MTGAYCKGEEREERIQLLADGDLSHQEIADKQGVSLQAIHDFSARNAQEWKAVQAQRLGALRERSVNMWVTDIVRRTAWRLRLIEDMAEMLEDPVLSETVYRDLAKTIDHLMHRVAEDHGQLKTRASVEMDITSPLARFDHIAQDTEGHWHVVTDRTTSTHS